MMTKLTIYRLSKPWRIWYNTRRGETMTQNLTLYYFNSCPFCQFVLRYLNDRKLDIPKKDILADASAKRELMEIGGKTQVPCLVIDGKALYESQDIINWLEDNVS